MAGTRLVIQATLLVELVALICIAAYFGLCRNNDVLCTPLFGQAGRSKLMLPCQWQDLYVFDMKRDEAVLLRRHELHVTLLLEDGSEWSDWARAMDKVLMQRNLVSHPCLFGPIQTDISLEGSLSKKSRAVVNAANETEYRVAGSAVKTWLSSRRDPHDVSRLDILLYVPIQAKSPLNVKLKNQRPTSALVWGRQLLTIVESTASKHASLENAVAYLIPFLQEQCQLSSNPTEWQQRLVQDTHERAKKSVLINHDIMSKASLKVPITNEVVQRWRRSMELVEKGAQLAKGGDHLDAIEMFEESLDISQSLLSDPSLMEPIDMQNDHYLAVFFPLLFPLLLPFIAGLIREVKRYRKLNRKETKVV